MRQKHKSAEQSNQVLRLNPNERRDPAGVVTEFFMTYDLKDTREILWEWLCAGLANTNHIFPEPIDRSNLLFFYENVEKLIEANHLQNRRPDHRPKRTRKKRFKLGNISQALPIQSNKNSSINTTRNA